MEPKINILLVDDKKENLISLQAALEEPFREFSLAQSGQEALELALKKEFGIILLDVQMPEMDGYEVAQYIKNHPKTKSTSIIFVTAINKEDKFVLKGYDAGAVDYLYKPLDIHLLRAKVKAFETLYFHRKELDATNKELMQINEKLDRFVSVVSHDLKTPLNGILSLIDFVEEDIKNGETQEVLENLSLIKSSAFNLKKMINGILEYSKVSRNKTKPEWVILNDLLKELENTMLLTKKVKINMPDKICKVFTEQVKIRQVFQNLIDNAVKYNDKEICIIEIDCTDSNEFFTIKITDNGPGIPLEKQDLVFELFKTIDDQPNQNSSGIGLSLVKTLVEDQGGKIWIESELGKGSSFIFNWKK